jgi:PAS domain S-box-containing protein
LFEDSIDPIIITDREGNIVECNRQAALIINVSKEILNTQNIHDVHEVDLASLGEPHFQNLSTSEMISYESVVRSKDSEIELPIQVYVRQIVLDDAEYLQWILRDIRERKRLDTLRDDLVSMIYHDLRSPLANVIYSMEVIKSLLPEGDELYLPLIEIAVRSTERIQRLTSSLLDIKKLEAGQPIVERNTVAISDLIKDAILAVNPGAVGKEQQIKPELSPDLPLIHVDENMIRRVLINLLENAIKFSPRGGQISIGAMQIEEGISIWVQDSGSGIQADKLDLIFEKFTRIDTNQKGLGLGLAFCRMAIEGHGGKIWVDSELGKGSRFNFILPLE